MSNRLYYTNPALHDFDSVVEETLPPSNGQPRSGVVLRETAFYPTSGGQVYDTGWLTTENGGRVRVAETAENADGTVVHYLEGDVKSMPAGTVIYGAVDRERRRDHMQQHSGQHVLSAAFVELYQIPTVSFHMGDETCTIDLDAKSLTAEQVRQAEFRANQVVLEDRPVSMQFVSAEKAKELGVRKIPP